MTGAEKNTIASFLDVSGASLCGGFLTQRKQYDFADDVEPPPAAEPPVSIAAAVFAAEAPQAEIIEAPEPLAAGSIDGIAQAVRACTACPLAAQRKNAVPGEGVSRPLVMIIGEGPGADEDDLGRPFVGKAGQLLDKMLASICLSREKNCFIANVVKCRPPGNRDPLPLESGACLHFLREQIALLKPRLILTVGRIALTTLMGTAGSISRLRGIWQEYLGIPLLPTFHPSYLLRDETQKPLAWEDMKSLCRHLARIDADYAELSARLRNERHI